MMCMLMCMLMCMMLVGDLCGDGYEQSLYGMYMHRDIMAKCTHTHRIPRSCSVSVVHWTRWALLSCVVSSSLLRVSCSLRKSEVFSRERARYMQRDHISHKSTNTSIHIPTHTYPTLTQMNACYISYTRYPYTYLTPRSPGHGCDLADRSSPPAVDAATHIHIYKHKILDEGNMCVYVYVYVYVYV
ncbi:hypothetical protein EON63_14740 [archaeon]|nr:MAG: hypothetical protein EON63_14740 [archaeon]